jgi:hypothetical protein
VVKCLIRIRRALRGSAVDHSLDREIISDSGTA